MRTNERTIVILGAVAAAAAAVVACGSQGSAARDRLIDTGPPAPHAVHAARLQLLMRDLDRLTLGGVAQELEPDRDCQRTRQQIHDAAAAIAESADRIPEILNEVELSSEKRDLFVALAGKLRDQALVLGDAAERGGHDRLSAAFDGMVASCNACHTAFRVLPTLTSRSARKRE